MNSVVEEIKSRLNIVDFIGQYIRLNKAGANWKALCPFHNEKTPSFMVHEEKQIWHCFGCGKGGDIFGFLMEMEKLEFKEALKILAEKAGVELPVYNKLQKEEISDKNKVLEILELATKFYETQLWKGIGQDKILSYLRGRGLKDNVIKEFRLGYAPPGWRNLLKFLAGRGYKIEDIEKTGLLVKKDTNNQQLTASDQFYDRFRDRIIFPIADILGKIIGFSARVSPGSDESQAKYVNTPETIVYHKSQVLYGIDKAKKEIKDKDEAILVEGNMDAIAAYQAGVRNTVAVSGTALTPEQLDILKRYSQNLKMFFDMDQAGQKAARHSAEIALGKGLNVYIIEAEEGKDAAEIVAKNQNIFIEAVKKAQPAMEYFFAEIFKKYNKNSAIEKKKIADEVLEIIKNIGNEIEQHHWLQKLAEELKIDFKILAGLLKKKLTQDRGRYNQPEKETGIISEDRISFIRKKIIGLMLAYPKIWQWMIENYGQHDFFYNDHNFQALLRYGPECGFEFERFLTMINDQQLEKIFSNLAFENRYEFQESNKIEEIGLEEAMKLAKNCVFELEKEERKKKMESLRWDIKKAEKEKNQEELKILIEEFNKLSKNFNL